MSYFIEIDDERSKHIKYLKQRNRKIFKLQDAEKEAYGIESYYWSQKTDNQLTLIKPDRKIISDFGLLHKVQINLANETIQVQSFLMKGQCLFSFKSSKLVNFVGKQIIKWQSQLLHTKLLLDHQKGLVKLKSFCLKYNSDSRGRLQFDILLAASKITQSLTKRYINNIKKILIISNYLPRKTSENILVLQEANRCLYVLTLNPFFQYSQSKTNFASVQKHYKEEQDKIAQIKKNINNQIYNSMQATLLYDKQFETAKKIEFHQLIGFQYIQRSVLKSWIQMPVLQNQYVSNQIKILNIQICKQAFEQRRYSSVYFGVVKFDYICSNNTVSHEQELKQKKINSSMVKRMVFKMPNDQLFAQQKISHQKQIISKMRGGSNYFLPKYYLTHKDKYANSILMDFIQGPSLRSYLDQSEVSSLWTKIYLIFGIVQGLRFLRSYQIAHLDLKPTNIMITKKMTTKIIDFGQSYHPEICGQGFRPGYTLPYSPPQIFTRIKFTEYSQKQDVYSLGVMIFQIIFSRYPFQANYWKLMKQYLNNKFQKCIFSCPQDLEDLGEDRIMVILFYLTMRCLSPNPENRPYLDWIALIIKQCLNYYRES